MLSKPLYNEYDVMMMAMKKSVRDKIFYIIYFYPFLLKGLLFFMSGGEMKCFVVK